MNLAGGMVRVLILNPMIGNILKGAVDRDSSVIIDIAWQGSLTCVLFSLIMVTCSYVGEHVALMWRRIMTDHVHRDYFAKQTAYSILQLDGRIDNTDQRIADSIQVVAYNAVGLILGNFKGGFPLLMLVII